MSIRSVRDSAKALLNKKILNRFMSLPLDENVVQVTYVWIDNTGENLRSKDRTLDFVPKCLEEIPAWSFVNLDTNFDALLRPVALYKDPIRRGHHLLVLCAAYEFDGTPTGSNHRKACLGVLEKCKDEEPWFGIEQEYTLIDFDGHPLGWPKYGFPGRQGPYHCAVGADKVCGRDIVEAHYRACLYAGIKISGTNSEVMPAQWEYQIGPRLGISAADDLWMSRYLLHRIAEEFGVVVTLDPKPIPGDWNGAGAHTNVSTKKMRESGGIAEIEKAISKLALHHQRHLKVYDPKHGKDNIRRLTGENETSLFQNFNFGVADRRASIRIPRHVSVAGKGYFEDRRPSANCDPYLVIEAILRTICLNE